RLSASGPPPSAPLCPYTTLFRSVSDVVGDDLESIAFGRQLRAHGCHMIAGVIGQIAGGRGRRRCRNVDGGGEVLGHEGPYLGLADRKSTRLNSSHVSISYAVFCL